ncbi:hypothetical protein [Spirosoma sp. KNUC1025]|uniref:hypothetical protein n=1 Tax=Spirosoma sp. KNUC1025 TaxID=2894082 RepID=UPI003869AD46|nr:hypothetical protein LN737_19710 [Spirosoma sp. KNUC1025]
MKTILNKNSLGISKRVLDLSNRDLNQLIRKIPELLLQEVTFPIRGLGKPTLFPGSWRRFPVKIANTLAVPFDQLHFVVLDGGGKVSTAVDPTFDPKNPHVVLLAGARSGTYKLVALAPGTNGQLRAVGHLEFIVDARKAGAIGDGPPLWIDGQVNGIGPGQGTWGENGPTGQVIQTYPEVAPAIGTKRVLVLLVDTASDRYPAADMPAILTNWKGVILDGANSNDGVMRSMRSFYEEISYYVKDAKPAIGLTIDAQIAGPISLPGVWEDYFPSDYAHWSIPDPTDPEPDETKKKQIITRRFYNTPYHFQPVVDVIIERNKTAAPADQIDLTNFDIMCCVIRSVHPSDPKDAFKTYWPWRHYLSVKIPAPTAGDPAATVNKNMDPFSMPDDWTDFDGRTYQDTVCHEFGHSLGLGDLYTPAVLDVGAKDPAIGPVRNLAHWDTMGFSDFSPHFSLVSRLKLGWIRPEWLKRFNFLIKNDVDETFWLSKVEKGAPQATAYVGAEIRMGSSWNYYLEYRARVMGQIGDNHLPIDDRIVCTDAIAQGYQSTSVRPEVLLLKTDATVQSNGAILGPGQNYLELDTDGSGKQLKISVVEIKNGLAKVRVQYKVFGVDLGIRPWPAAPDRPWQSPDIEVRNEKSKKDPAYFNTAWTGQSNDIVAKITNSGTVDAPGVAVNFSIKDFNVGGNTPVTSLFFKDVRDVPAGATVEFVAPNWIPPINGHFCIQVEVLPYATAGPPLSVDMNPQNSLAQSNYSTSNLDSASPTERTIATVKVGNPYDNPTIAYLIPSQNNPFYRTYLSNRWIYLKPKEVREVTVMMESRLDWDDEHQAFVPLMSTGELRDLSSGKIGDFRNVLSYVSLPNQVSLATYMPNSITDPNYVVQLLGGAQIQVRSGRKVQIIDFQPGRSRTTGGVVTTGRPVSAVRSGQVILIYSNPSDSRKAYLTLPVLGGLFRTGPIPQMSRFRDVQAYFIPNGVYGSAYSEVIPIKDE